MIRAYVGLWGSGKSLSMVTEALRVFRNTYCQVYTDMATLRFPHAVYWSAEQPELMAQVSEGLVLMDEAQVMADARKWQQVPSDVLLAWAQGRKNKLDLVYTTQQFEAVDTRLRSLTAEVVRCKRYGPMWLHIHQRPGYKEVLRKRWIFPSRTAMKLYDTYELIGRRVGQGAGRSDHLAQVRAGLSPDKPRHRDNGNPYSESAFRWYAGRNAVLKPKAHAVIDYLTEQGTNLNSREWVGMVEAEMSRWNWLNEFGLYADDLPQECTFENPWLPGWSPAEVHARVQAEKEIDKVEDLIKQRERAARRSAIGGK